MSVGSKRNRRRKSVRSKRNRSPIPKRGIGGGRAPPRVSAAGTAGTGVRGMNQNIVPSVSLSRFKYCSNEPLIITDNWICDAA